MSNIAEGFENEPMCNLFNYLGMARASAGEVRVSFTRHLTCSMLPHENNFKILLNWLRKYFAR